MTHRQRVLATLAAHGADFGDHSGPGEFRASAWLPAGVVWATTLTHGLAWSFHSDRPAGWRAAWDDVQDGVVPCSADGCDTCQGV